MRRIIFIVNLLLLMIFILILSTRLLEPPSSIEIPYFMENKSNLTLEITYYFIDVISHETKFSQQKFTLKNNEEKTILHPEYDIRDQYHVFVELRDIEGIAYTYSLGAHTKKTKLIIYENPLRIEKIEQ